MKRKILIVDDEKEFVGLFQEFLQGEGYDVRVAFTGTEGQRICNEFLPDLTFLDIRMPEQNGLDVLKAMTTAHPHPVLMLTAIYDQKTVSKCLELGARDYITKPIDLDEVKGRIEKVFQQ